MLNQEFQESLKNLRNQYNLTQDELGKKIGVSGQTIYKYENDVTFPPPEKIESILSFFEVVPNTLFGYRSKSENIDKLLKLIANESKLRSNIQSLLSEGDVEDIQYLLTNFYPFLQGFDLNTMLDFNQYSFESAIKKNNQTRNAFFIKN